jgi:voltage-gated potassium channel
VTRAEHPSDVPPAPRVERMARAAQERVARPLVTHVRHLIIETVLASGVIILTYAFLPLEGEYRWFGRALGVLVLLSVIPLVARRLGRVLRADKPVAEAIAAVVVTATLAVMASSGIYYAMATADPDNFRGLATKIDGAYFAVTVMTTTGFGDIVPASEVARLVTTIHIVFTVALLGAAFRLFTWAAKHRLTGDRRQDAP